jgi:hypothetical protein
MKLSDEKVDIYSFAMIMYELYFQQLAFGECLEDPSINLFNFYHLVANKRLRPALPDLQSEEYNSLKRSEQVYLDLMVICWSHEPTLRPEFATVLQQLHHIRDMI